MKYTDIDGATRDDVGKYVALQNGVCPMAIADSAEDAIRIGNATLPEDAIGTCTAAIIEDDDAEGGAE